VNVMCYWIQEERLPSCLRSFEERIYYMYVDRELFSRVHLKSATTAKSVALFWQ
jgi:hypothetical protein